MRTLALFACCVAVSCTQAPPVNEPSPQPPPVPPGSAQVAPIRAEAPQAAPMEAPPASPEDQLQAYATAVSRAIRARLVLPPKVPQTASAVYELTLRRDGSVSRLRTLRRSGFPAYDAAIRRAIRRAQPFPPFAAVDPDDPTRLQLTFKVKE